jgi:hypothetical protein
MLPRELWIIILKIKWWTARKNRLISVLEFPTYDENSERGSLYDTIYFYCLKTSRYTWWLYSNNDGTFNNLYKISVRARVLPGGWDWGFGAVG